MYIGNIYCDTGIIYNTIVLGNVVAQIRVETEQVIIGSLFARSVNFKKNNRIIHPYVASENEPSFIDKVDYLLFVSDNNTKLKAVSIQCNYLKLPNITQKKKTMIQLILTICLGLDFLC